MARGRWSHFVEEGELLRAAADRTAVAAIVTFERQMRRLNANCIPQPSEGFLGQRPLTTGFVYTTSWLHFLFHRQNLLAQYLKPCLTFCQLKNGLG